MCCQRSAIRILAARTSRLPWERHLALLRLRRLPGLAACPLQGPEDDGGSAVQSFDVEIRPKSAAAVQGLADEWLLAYQVGWGGAA